MDINLFLESLKKGGQIKIKSKNKGKFTEYCGGKVTLSCINKAKKSNNPVLRKRAVFAENARKWKHLNGGILKYSDGGISKYYGDFESAFKKDTKTNTIPWIEPSRPNTLDTYDFTTKPKYLEELEEEQTEEQSPVEYTYKDYDRSVSKKREKQLDLMKSPTEKKLEFDKLYDEFEKTNPEAKKYRKFLTEIASKESGFDSYILNTSGAPAFGYFLFMQDGKKYNNISNYAGTDIETFRNNPMLQLNAALKLAKDFERGFSPEDLQRAKLQGYSMNSLLAGAWLGGNTGVRKFLRGQGNPSDRSWSSSGAGTDVGTRMKEFNF